MPWLRSKEYEEFKTKVAALSKEFEETKRAQIKLADSFLALVELDRRLSTVENRAMEDVVLNSLQNQIDGLKTTLEERVALTQPSKAWIRNTDHKIEALASAFEALNKYTRGLLNDPHS